MIIGSNLRPNVTPGGFTDPRKKGTHLPNRAKRRRISTEDIRNAADATLIRLGSEPYHQFDQDISVALAQKKAKDGFKVGW